MMAVLCMATGASGAVETGKPLAKVNGKAITERDLRAALSSLNELQRDSMLKDMTARSELVNRLIDQEVLAQEAEKSKLDQTQDFKDMMDAFRKQALSTLFLQKRIAGRVTDENARKFYQAHKPRYTTDQVHVQHILLATEEEAKKLLPLAKDPKSDFQALAEKYSKDPSAKNNRGDIGFITRETFTSDFTDVAFLTKTGTISGPSKTAFGWHLIKVIDRKSGKPLTFEEAELRIRNDMVADVSHEEIAKLKKDAKIEK